MYLAWKNVKLNNLKKEQSKSDYYEIELSKELSKKLSVGERLRECYVG